MTTKANLLLNVAQLALEIGKKHLADYSHPKSPQTYTQPQLLACLVLKTYLRTTYRGIIDVLAVSDKLTKALKLKAIPNYSTLKYFADRIDLDVLLPLVFADLAGRVADEEGNEIVAIDSTGMESTSASVHFQQRKGGTRKQYVKLSVCILCGSLLPLSLATSKGPCNDKCEAKAVITQAFTVHCPSKLLADAGYDAEWVHGLCRDEWGVKSFIPAVIHRKDGTVGGKYRSQMTERRLKYNQYGRRWLVESFMSGLKRTMGSALSSRSETALFAEAKLRVLAYAIRR